MSPNLKFYAVIPLSLTLAVCILLQGAFLHHKVQIRPGQGHQCSIFRVDVTTYVVNSYRGQSVFQKSNEDIQNFFKKLKKKSILAKCFRSFLYR